MSSTAPLSAPGPDDLTVRARITHPFHPLHGREIVVVDQRRNRHGDRVWYQVPDGRVRTMPRAWTSLATLDAFEVISAGRAFFRSDDLARLAALLDAVRCPDIDTEGAE